MSEFLTSIMPSLALGILQAEWGTGICLPPKERPEVTLNGKTFYYQEQIGLSPAFTEGSRREALAYKFKDGYQHELKFFG